MTHPSPQSSNRMERLDALLKQVDNFPDEHSARTTREIVQLLMDLHGSAFEKILEIISAKNPALVDQLAYDDLIGNLLILYSLHPHDMETRVRAAITKANSNAEILSVNDGAVRIKLIGEFPPKETVEQAIYDHVPDVTTVEIVAADQPAHAERFALPILAK